MKTTENKIECVNEEQLKKLREEIVGYVDAYEWSYFITLTFKHEVKDDVVISQIVEKFVNVLSAMAFGNRSKKRVNVFPFAESHKSGGLHVHLLLEDIVPRIENKNRASQFDVEDSVAIAWMKCSSKTTHPKAASGYQAHWFQDIYDIKGVLNYVTKDIEKRRNPALFECACLTGRRG